MDIYFCGSIRAGRGDAAWYGELISMLQAHGRVLSEHVGDPDLAAWGEDQLPDEAIYERDLRWLRQSAVVVAEVSTPSLGVGFELGQAVALGKPVLCLYRPDGQRRLSAMVNGSPAMTVVACETLSEARAAFEAFVRRQ
jgi:nucleoside 2-deoxyribosyltransferase